MTLALPPREIRIRRPALDKLLLYAARCPVEIGGLGMVAEEAGGLTIADVFLLPQRVSAWDTELDPEALLDLLGRLVAEGRDVAGVRLWWHSHGDMDLVWSETDAATIANLPGDFWVALLANRRGEILCRLDAFTPRRRTWDLPLVEVLDGDGSDLETLQASIDREIEEKVRACAVTQEVIGGEIVAPAASEYPVPLIPEPVRTPPERGGAGKVR